MFKLTNTSNLILGNITDNLTNRIQNILEPPKTSKNQDLHKAISQIKVMDKILAHMVQISYPNKDWAEILPVIMQIAPSSVATIAENLEKNQNIASLLKKLPSKYASLTLSRCYDIAMSNGNLTLAEQEILSQIALDFNLNLSKVTQ